MKKFFIVTIGVLTTLIFAFCMFWFIAPTRYFADEDIEPVKDKIAMALSVDGNDLICVGSKFCRESTHLFKIAACDMSFHALVPIKNEEKYRDESRHLVAVIKMFQPDQSPPVFDKIYEVRLKVDTLLVARVNDLVYIVFLGMT